MGGHPVRICLCCKRDCAEAVQQNKVVIEKWQDVVPVLRVELWTLPGGFPINCISQREDCHANPCTMLFICKCSFFVCLSLSTSGNLSGAIPYCCTRYLHGVAASIPALHTKGSGFNPKWNQNNLDTEALVDKLLEVVCRCKKYPVFHIYDVMTTLDCLLIDTDYCMNTPQELQSRWCSDPFINHQTPSNPCTCPFFLLLTHYSLHLSMVIT